MPGLFGKVLLASQLLGKAADAGQGILDFVADMGHHLAQGGQALLAQQLLFQAFPFPQVPEIADDPHLPAVFPEEAGRQPDGHRGAVFRAHQGFIIFQDAGPAVGRGVDELLDFVGQPFRIKNIDL